ncbi:hypothetical protein F4778DRAFT_664911 [Xylariomycetidae sp. FL2044]|nr:hypothetical protein F4778DRAFT_664889 [Xylariomycetidae sp. FL2044]KAH9883372.1 hypothetical protein F4778DRAFT_664911 [Xylariomycetidae sp. FL2044]
MTAPRNYEPRNLRPAVPPKTGRAPHKRAAYKTHWEFPQHSTTNIICNKSRILFCLLTYCLLDFHYAMLCEICRSGLEGIWNPQQTQRLGTYADVLAKPGDEALPRSMNNPDAAEPERCAFAHHATFESFRDSRDQGCVMCNRFRPAPEHVDLHPRLQALGYFSAFTVSLGNPSRVMMCVFHGDHQGAFALEPYQDGDSGIVLNLSPYTGDPDTWDTVDRWTGACNRDHRSCRHDGPRSFTPTWLLAVRGADASESLIRLVKGDSLDPDARYLTLSHCRGLLPGGSQRPGLIQELVQDWQAVGSFPKLLRDTIEAARRLGAHYVWIDSLCNTSNDASPAGLAEAQAERDTAYRHSDLNIAALAASTSDEGLFFPREPSAVVPTVVHLHIKDASCPPSSYVFSFEKTWSWRLTLESEPLINQGHFVSERLLARRTLLFGRKQVFWECHGQSACELHPDSTPYAPPTTPAELGRHHHHFKPSLDISFYRRADTPARQLVLDWYRVAEYYNSREHASAGEKIARLSGLAAEVAGKLRELSEEPGEEKNLAGHWTSTFPESLLWNTREMGGRRRRVEAGGAPPMPSWSWMAVDAPLNVLTSYHDEYTWISRFVSADASPSSRADESLDVVKEGGAVVFEGPLAVAKLAPPAERANFPSNTWLVVRLENLHGGEIDASKAQGASQNEQQHARQHIYGRRVLFDTPDDVRQEVLCLPIRGDPRGSKFEVYGLALIRDAEEPGSFRRMGAMFFSFEDKDAALQMMAELGQQTVRIR